MVKQVLIKQQGQILMELVLAFGLTAILLPALITAFVSTRSGRVQEQHRLDAWILARSTIEQIKQVREVNFNDLPSSGTYYPVLSGNRYILTVGSEVANGFTRSVLFEPVSRDANFNMVTSGGTVDPSTLKATVTVSWSADARDKIQTSTYLTRFLSNTFWQLTSQSDFSSGTFTNTQSGNSTGGEVSLGPGSGGSGTWSSPTLSYTYNYSGNNNGNCVYVSGNYAYLSFSGTPGLVILDITNPAAPVVMGNLALNATVNDIMVVGNYVYLATNNIEFVIVNATNKSAPAIYSQIDLAGNADANAIFVNGSVAYVGRATSGDPEFYAINISNPAAPSTLGSLNGNLSYLSVWASGNYAYVATSSNSQELHVINVTTPATPSLATTLNLTSVSVPSDLFGVGNTVYIGVSNDNSNREFYAVNVSTPTTPTIAGTYEVGGTIYGVYAVGTQAFVTTSTQMSVLNVATPASISLVGQLTLTSQNADIFVSGDYAYIANSNNAAEMYIVKGGNATPYALSGIYETTTFDAGKAVGYNYFLITTTKPATTNVQVQIAVNDTGSPFTFVGPDGTSGTFYTASAAIPLNQAKGRYFRARATLSGDGTVTPYLERIQVNYSP